PATLSIALSRAALATVSRLPAGSQSAARRAGPLRTARTRPRRSLLPRSVITRTPAGHSGSDARGTIQAEPIAPGPKHGTGKQGETIMNPQMTIDTIDRQRRYVETQKEKSKGLGLVFADAFLRGMRDLGYKSPGWALAEILDNSLQAAA